MTVGVWVALAEQNIDIGGLATLSQAGSSRQGTRMRSEIPRAQRKSNHAEPDNPDQRKRARGPVARPQHLEARSAVLHEQFENMEHAPQHTRGTTRVDDGDMTRVAIIGAHGKVGQQLMHVLYDRSDEFVGIARGADHAEDIYRLGGEGVLLDIETASVDELAAAIDGCDAVVFTAGAGGGSGTERKRTVDYGGSVKSAAAAERSGIRRFIQVSAWGVDSPVEEDADETWAAYVQAKHDADTELRERDLDWTILRPGALTTADGSGRVTLGDSVPRGSISREDVARLIVALLEAPASAGHTWEVISGETAVDDAVAQLLRTPDA